MTKRRIIIFSDLHIDRWDWERKEIFMQFLKYVEREASEVYILGDLFEVWVGDDAAIGPGFAGDCAAVLQAAAGRLAVFFMHGNRDFLLGDGFLRSCRTTLLSDPTVLTFAGRRWLLTHGDALCLADTEYMKFREQVRAPAWQREFLAKSLGERQAIASSLREQSEARKRSAVQYIDVDGNAAGAWLEAADAQVLIHGHTHRPADHPLGERQRIVLSDWDAASKPPRLQALRLGSAGARRIALA